ncbi:putative uncharacterized protein FLJ13197, partial [Eschrichtius robustus]|uniref:putative uncharacterized protein FLJ13197 n=1 Tax=Eschrichtius robustus TaxID=9764 RepID=UPI0035BFC6D5
KGPDPGCLETRGCSGVSAPVPAALAVAAAGDGDGDGRACGGRGSARLGSAGARAALQLGPRLRAAPLLALLWLLAPTPGSHMTPAPLALRASQGWRGKFLLLV